MPAHHLRHSVFIGIMIRSNVSDQRTVVLSNRDFWWLGPGVFEVVPGPSSCIFPFSVESQPMVRESQNLSASWKAGNVSCACPTASSRRRCSNDFQCWTMKCPILLFLGDMQPVVRRGWMMPTNLSSDRLFVKRWFWNSANISIMYRIKQ